MMFNLYGHLQHLLENRTIIFQCCCSSTVNSNPVSKDLSKSFVLWNILEWEELCTQKIVRLSKHIEAKAVSC